MRRMILALTLGLLLPCAFAACGSNRDTVGQQNTGGGGGFQVGPGVDCMNGPDYTNCPCNAGDTKTCYTGPPATRGVGACKDGVQTCEERQELRYSFGPCTGETLPSETNGGCVAPDAGPPDTGTPDACPSTDPVAHGMVVFGGSDDSSKELDETWIFDGSTWKQIVTPGPSGRRGAMMATLGGKVILFGGIGGQTAHNDTWEFDGATWKQIQTQGPPGRYWGLLAPVDGKLMLFGGIDGAVNTTYGDTWLFDCNGWTQVTGPGPSARYAPAGGAMAGGKVVVLGGIGPGTTGQLSDEWIFDGTKWATISATGPTVRSFSLNMTLGGQALIAGGDNGGNASAHYSDTWTFDGTKWTQRATAFNQSFWDLIDISSGTECGAAITGTTVGFLGQNEAATAVFNGTSWTRVVPPNQPPHRVGCAAASLL